MTAARITATRCLLIAFVLGTMVNALVVRAQDALPTVTVVQPRCESATDPAGIEVAQPRLFWQMKSPQRGEMQSAYQVLVASAPQLLAAGTGDLWDSGKVDGDQSTFIRYAGQPLTSSQQVFWKVRVWDRSGGPSPWGPVGQWTMGLLAAADWRGTWIEPATPAQSVLLRREFTIKPALRRATVHVSGLGQYEMNVNGGKVGDDLLTPGWTTYKKTILYDTYDVTRTLHEGANAIGLTLGNGMYRVERPPQRFTKFIGSFGEQRALLHLRLDYADGTTEYVGTDSNWKTHDGPVTFNGIYSGEDFDARRVPAGWDKPGFADQDWKPAVEVGKADDTLHGFTRSAEPVREIEAHKPINVQTFPNGGIVYDFGQNASFMPRLTVSGLAGSTVRLTPAEVAMPDGSIFRGTSGGGSRGSSWWQYTKTTDGPETWFPQFFYIGGRYLYAELVPPGREPTPPSMSGIYPQDDAGPVNDAPARRPKIDALEAVVVHSTAEPVGTFATSSPLLNRIRENVRWAQRSNLMSIITDCPHREKLGWLEQLNMNGPSLGYEFNVARLFAKSENDMADAQDDSGLVPNIAPEYTTFKGTYRAAAEWGASFIAVPWRQYQFTGDTDSLRQHYDAMKQYFAYLETKTDAEGILSEGLGDWYDLGKSKPGKSQLTPPPVTATAFLYEDAVTLSRIAAALKLPDAKLFADKAETIRSHYLKKFFNADVGTFAMNTQCSNALPLAMGMVEPADRPRVLEALIKAVEANSFGQTTADVGFRYMLRALADAGRSDVVYKVVTQDAKPGYARQVKNGETTLTESWDANRTSSHNHFMLGQVIEWFFGDLAGINVDPDHPGFKNTIIRPQPVGDLAWVEASHASLYGTFSVRWERTGDRLKLRIEVPANTSATVYIPARDTAPVFESGQPADKAAGVRFLRREGDRSIYSVQSGQYAFESAW